MAFFGERKTKKLVQGEFILPAALVWEDTTALRIASASYPLPVNVVTGGAVISTITSGRKTITTAGTRETLVASSTPSKQVLITAFLGNTGVVVVGGSTVVAAPATRNGTPLEAGDSCIIEIDNAQKIYLDVTVSGEGVTWNILN